MESLYNTLKKMKIGSVDKNESLKKFNTYRLSGTISIVVYPDDEKALIKLIKFLRVNKIKHKVLGLGSNVLFVNDSYDGVLIRLDKFNHIEINDTIVKAGAGVSLTKLAFRTIREGLAGMEFATGIPGTVGGGVYMNAGAYKSDMGYIVSEIKVLDEEYCIKTIYNKEINFHYRTSLLKENPKLICLEATFVLKKGKKEVLKSVVEDRKKRRLMTQPLNYPSAGSVFRNPDNDYAGRLIEVLGYKGQIKGGAAISEKHANFIVNLGAAKGSEIKFLMMKIKKDVEKEFGVELKIEQEFID